MPEFENRTRQGLDAALRELLREKPLDQIRVRELTERCGLRRQSFYYHFTDVYDLFRWSAGQERECLWKRLGECLTWQQALAELLDHIAGERAFYRAVLDFGGDRALGELIPVGEVLATVQAYYRGRCGASMEHEGQEGRWGAALLLSMLEGWIRGTLTLAADEIISSLERTVEHSIAGAVWQTLQKRGDWTPFE